MAPPTSNTPVLGELEIQVLEYLWSNEAATAKEAHRCLGKPRGTSVNTVQSAMERLFRKGFLSRSKSGHAYRYSPLVEKKALLASLINDVVGRFNTDSLSSAAAILDAAERIDENALDLLEAEIKKRRGDKN